MWSCNKQDCTAIDPLNQTSPYYNLVCPHHAKNKGWIEQQDGVEYTDILHVCPKDNILIDMKICVYANAEV